MACDLLWSMERYKCDASIVCGYACVVWLGFLYSGHRSQEELAPGSHCLLSQGLRKRDTRTDQNLIHLKQGHLSWSVGIEARSKYFLLEATEVWGCYTTNTFVAGT